MPAMLNQCFDRFRCGLQMVLKADDAMTHGKGLVFANPATGQVHRTTGKVETVTVEGEPTAVIARITDESGEIGSTALVPRGEGAFGQVIRLEKWEDLAISFEYLSAEGESTISSASTLSALGIEIPFEPDREMVNAALDSTADFLHSTYEPAARVAMRGGSMKDAWDAVRGACDPKFSGYAIYEHCLPFNVARAYDEARDIDTPRIWTAERDRQMWEALQG